MQRRILTLFMAVLSVAAVMTGSLTVTAGTAAAAPADSHYVATWNLQGSSHSSENKWNTGVAQMMNEYRLLALQEAGSVPDSAAHVRDHTITAPSGRQWTVEEYTWGGTSTRPGSYIYWLQTDPNGNRVNLALVSATQAEQVDVVEGPYRPALGIRTGSGYYFSLHGSSSGGGDVPTLLGNIDDAVSEHGNDDNTTYSWFALGDYNREPQAGGLGYVVCPPAAPTHPATSPTRYLDFMVRDSGVELTGHVLAVHLSDHLAVRFSFPPTTSSHQLAERNLRVMPLGDSITYGIGSATTSGYRAPLWDRLHGRARSLDFVGSQQSGQLPDRDNEGHSGAMISQIAGAADSSVPLTRPNVVALHAGTNDMDRGDPGAAPDRLDGLIGQVLDDAPGTTVLVATLVPSTSETTQARITGFNREIRALVAERQGAGQRVSLIDMSAVTTADLADYLHPNDTGYGKMADAFYRGIAAAVHDGWIQEPAAGEPGECRDTPNRWEERGRIAQGTGASLLDIEFADVDGDGRDDYLVVDSETGAVDAWLNRGGDRDGNPGWEARGRIAQGTGHRPRLDQIYFADVDGDGRDDYLVVHSETGAVDAWLNRGGDRDGNPGWEARGRIAQGVGAEGWPVFADVDGDGRDDYLVMDGETGAVDAWLNRGGDRDGNPGWEARGRIAQGGLSGVTDGIVLANVDCDRRTDYVVLRADGRVDAWLNRGGDRDGNPGWVERGRIATGIGGRNNPVFADIDGDGRDDYLLLDTGGAVRAWLNRGGDPV